MISSEFGQQTARPSTDCQPSLPLRIGILGLGDMGLPFARSLRAGGYDICGFDLRPERMDLLEKEGIASVPDAGSLAEACDVVVCSLPSSETFVHVAETILLPAARPGQVVLDTGTTVVSELRRLVVLLRDKGTELLDAPLSGGKAGAEQQDLFIWVGGNEKVFLEMRPLLICLGGSEKLVYCGGSGAGQIVKGINQLRMGLMAAAELEAFAFGEGCGLDSAVVRKALSLGGHPGGPMAECLAAGEGLSVGVKFRELPYFLAEAATAGFELPLTKTLHAFCDASERVVIDDHRPAPSFWHALGKAKCSLESGA